MEEALDLSSNRLLNKISIIILMAMTSKISLLFRIAIQISYAIWHPKYDTKQETVTCNFTVSFLGQLMA